MIDSYTRRWFDYIEDEEEDLQILIDANDHSSTMYELFCYSGCGNYEPIPDPPKQSITSLMWWRR